MSKHKGSRSLKKLSRKAPLLGILVVALVVGYVASGNDLVYSARSLMASAVSALDSSPRIVITRDANSPNSRFMPTPNRVFAKFAVTAVNIDQSSAHFNVTGASVSVSAGTPVLKAANFSMRYDYCEPGKSCKTTQIPVTVVATGTPTRYLLSPSSGVMPLPLSTGAVSYLYVSGQASYDEIYAANTQTASLVASIDSATPVGDVVTSVDTSLAQGSSLPLIHGPGYAYGSFDYNNNGKFDSQDGSFLITVVQGKATCPTFKLCDVNSDGRLNFADNSRLQEYYQNKLPPPVTAVTVAPAPTPTPSVQTPPNTVVGTGTAGGKVEITRNANSPAGGTIPTPTKVLAKFDVKSVEGGATTFKLSEAQVFLNNSGPTLRAGGFYLQYDDCTGVNQCQPRMSIPITVTENITGTKTYTLAPVAETVLPVRAGATSFIYVLGYPNYDEIYLTRTDTSSLTARIIAATNADGSAIDLSGAQGNELTIYHRLGYGYGSFDFDNNSRLNEMDGSFLITVVQGNVRCPLFKICNVNGTGGVDYADVSLLQKYAQGTLPPPSTASPVLDFISAATTVDAGTSANDDMGTFTIRYKITASGGDTYVGRPIVSVDRNGTVVANGVTTTTSSSGIDGPTSAGNYLLRSGESTTFTTTTTVQLPTAGTSGQYRASISSIRWGVSDTATLPNNITTGLDALKTNYQVLN